MLNTNILIAITGLLLVVIFLIYKKFSANRKNTNLTENTLNAVTVPGVLGINNRKQEDKKLTLQERIELSWKFLYDITDIIINKFSKEDVQQVNKYGHVLLENGGRYEHIVDLAIKQVKSQTQTVEQGQSKGSKLGV
ncbi:MULTISPECIES: DUF2660 domain-containing protein [unclassified Rickettsia]|uniref:DUF2660 domain-containing protein n=1 Tax=unclassified Rickettsia TaxID=114295 RepID=UPI0020A1EFBA|nr:DUF2660 domain-containing protein [Rickettsia endosymbiont of Ceutorhynchus assimilis]